MLGRIAENIAGRFVLAIIAVCWLFPIYWLVLTAFKLKRDIQSPDPVWLVWPVLDNFQWLQQNFSFAPLERSAIAVVVSVAVATFFGAMMAYALARFPFKRRNDVEFWIISTRMLPPEALVIPYYVILINLHLIDSVLGLIVVYTALNLPIVVWILLAFYRMLPDSVEEAARVDGCSRWGAYLRVVVPMSASNIVGTVLITAILTWNEFFIAFILTSSNITLPVEVASFLANGFNPQYGPMAAAGLLLTIPPLAIAVAGRKYLIRGLQGFAGEAA
jgi:ABC-type glycerol-3-phosphate transport system permease component